MSVRDEALRTAREQVGTRETSRNSGPAVDAYLSTVGMPPGFAWCAAFVYWCFSVGAASLNVPNPCPRTAGALRLWGKAPSTQKFGKRIEPEPGDVFVIDHGHGLGHVGFVAAVVDERTIATVEGNTNGVGAREGDGVYARTRLRSEIMGYVRLG